MPAKKEDINKQAEELKPQDEQGRLDKLYEFVIKGVEANFEEDGLIKPVWFLEDKTGEHKILCMTPVGDSNDKDELVAVMKTLFKEKDIARYIMVMEAWFVSRATTAEFEERAPSQCDDRMEAVIMVGEDRDTGENFFVMRKIDRSGPKPVLLPGDRTAGAEWGRFTNMFDKPRTKH